MASLPPQTPRPRSSPLEPTSDEQHASSTTPSTQDGDSSPFVVLNKSPTIAITGTDSKPGEPSTTLEPQPRTCWVCYEKDTDDTPETSPWRSPCPCSLVAHEECLLQWVTSQEASKPGEMPAPKHILCPQCKAEIRIDRPKDYIVIATDKIRRVVKNLILPGAVTSLFGCLYTGSLVYGINTIHVVFGSEAARDILAPSNYNRHAYNILQGRPAAQAAVQFFSDWQPFLAASNSVANWKLYFGLPMILPALVLSRTRIADNLFAILPITYFMFRIENRYDLHWPPGPGMTLALLPYIRTAYNETYRYAVGDLERKWEKAVQRKPREGETEEEVAQAAARAADNDDPIFNVEVEIVNEGEVAEQRNPADREGRLAPQNVRRERGEVQIPPINQAGGAQQQPNPQNVNAPERGNWELRQNISTVSLITSTMGALFFPVLSSYMGDILEATLPARWVTKRLVEPSRWLPGRNNQLVSQGLLQEKWGRTIIGGCLLVVLKDVVTLYCKWKKARDFGKARIVDYVRRR
ncbi:hypothetical protein B7494_g8436 [Chlorociboria aeruginascens]|nr:hypothetical protein B7494_g8436 [Chlorociboria aeruginascens]